MLNTDQTITLVYIVGLFSVVYAVTRLIIKWRTGKEFPLSEALIIFWIGMCYLYIQQFIDSNL